MNKVTIPVGEPSTWAVFLVPAESWESDTGYRQTAVIISNRSKEQTDSHIAALRRDHGWIFIKSGEVPMAPVELTALEILNCKLETLDAKEQRIRADRQAELDEIAQERAMLLSLEYSDVES